MITSREQLINCANQWLSIARSDLQKKMTEFIDAVGTSMEELSHILGISQNELEDILSGRGNISLATFAKLLIATDNAIEIKPIHSTPIGSYGRGAAQHTRKRNEAAMPHMPFMPQNGMMMPPMPPMGGRMPSPSMAQRMGAMARQMPKEAVKKIKVSRSELVNAVFDNSLEQEIDLVNATSDEIARFLQSKNIKFGKVEEPTIPQENVVRSRVEPTCDLQGGQVLGEQAQEDDTDFGRIMAMMADELRKNPNLLNQVKKFVKQ